MPSVLCPCKSNYKLKTTYKHNLKMSAVVTKINILLALTHLSLTVIGITLLSQHTSEHLVAYDFLRNPPKKSLHPRERLLEAKTFVR